jgi:hypothetical protein
MPNGQRNGTVLNTECKYVVYIRKGRAYASLFVKIEIPLNR